jgi:hypothetical protein
MFKVTCLADPQRKVGTPQRLGLGNPRRTVLEQCYLMWNIHIISEDSPRIKASRNRLGLSLSKRIRRGLTVKIDRKRKSRTYEALAWNLVEHSRARHAPMPIASPRRATPCPTQQGEASERAHVFIHFPSPTHSFKCIVWHPTLE